MTQTHGKQAVKLAGGKSLVISDVGRVDYESAYEQQRRIWENVFEERERETGAVGHVLLLEHVPPVITISRRKGADAHLVASEAALAREGIEVVETDRGGDITYHGPGQLVAYPILDLNALGLGLHAYMRLLEEIVIRTCASFGVSAERDSEATGVWVNVGEANSKICALGVRVRRWISMHGLALNVSTNLAHFNLIVPCGLVGRGVTSIAQIMGEKAPSIDEVKHEMSCQFAAVLSEQIESAASE